jgi:hypothetical protein
MSEDSIEARLARAKAANPTRRMYVADSPAGLLIFGAPKRADYLMYMTMATSDEGSDKISAREMSLKICAVDPPTESYAALLEEWPGLPGNGEVLKAIQLSVGVTKDTAAKK